MKTNALAIVLLLAAPLASAAVQYEFHQTSHSDIDQNAPSELVGRATIDGDRSRVDFLGGDSYPPDTYVVSTDGSRTLTFVDPVRKSFTQFNTANVAAAIGASRIEITNLQSNVEKLEDSQIVAGVPANHYRLTITYDMAVTFGAMPLKQGVKTVIDKWTTVAFGDVNETFLASASIRTGNPKVDEVIELEATKIKGLPLKQLVQVTTTNNKRAPGSPIPLSASRTSRREMTITQIREIRADGSLFAVPITFHKADPLQNQTSAQTQVQILSLESKAQ
jgi:hypothetical protein